MLNGTNVPQSNIGPNDDVAGMGSSQKAGWNRN